MQTSFVRSSVRSLSREQFHEVSYAEWGSSGDLGPVICVHGLTRQGRDFDFLAMKLAERRYKVLCPDVVGRGHSGHFVNPLDYDLQQYVLDMTVLIASLRAEQVDWIGKSLGGMIGILMAGLSNSPINSLVVKRYRPGSPVTSSASDREVRPRSLPIRFLRRKPHRPIFAMSCRLSGNWKIGNGGIYLITASDLTDKVDIAYTTTDD